MPPRIRIRIRTLAVVCLAILLLCSAVIPVLARYHATEEGTALKSHLGGNFYTVTYMSLGEVYAVDYVWNNTVAYTVRTDHPAIPTGAEEFGGWTYVGSTDEVTNIEAGNTLSLVLYANWVYVNRYTVRFVDPKSQLLYEEQFEEGAGLSSAGQAEIERILQQLEAEANVDSATTNIEYEVSWVAENSNGNLEDWDPDSLRDARADVTVRAEYTATNTDTSGILNIIPVYGDNDIVTHYEVIGTAGLTGDITVPGTINGIPVAVVTDISSDTLNTGLNRIEFLPGVQEIGDDAMAMTLNLSEVVIPSSVHKIGSNAFANTWGGTLINKTVDITFDGTWERWKEITEDGWDSGLGGGSRVICTDGTYQKSGGLGSGLQTGDRYWSKQ